MPEAPPLPDLLLVFNALPGANLLLAPDLRIVAASDDYLAATLTERAIIVGQHIFDAFPDNPKAPQAQAVPNVRASLLQVLATRQPHEMAPQHYDVPDRTQPGRFVERHWLPRHLPVLDAQGQVQFIIQSVQDITASRAAQRQLHESRASEQVARADAAQQRNDFQYFLEQAPVAVAVYHGPEFRITMANAATLAIWGRPLEDVLQRSVFEVLPEAASPEIIALFERVFNTGVAQMSYEQPTTIYRHGRQEVVYWNTVFEPQRDAAGHVSGIFTVGTDVTAQVRARQQVEQLNQDLEVRVQERTRQLEAARAATERQRRQWYELFRRAPASICVFDGPEWVYEFVNPGYQAMFPGRALLGKRLVDALPEVADQPLMEILHRVYDTGEPFEASEVLVPLARTDGGPVEDIYFDLTYQARYNEVGQIDGFVTYAYDVTAQVLARRERENHRQQLQRLFLEAPAAICMLSGPELVYEFVNPNYQQFFPERQLLGKPLREALPELADHAAYYTMRHVLDSGETVWQQALHVPVARTEDGVLEDRYFNYIQQPRYDEQGRVVGVLVFGFEVTVSD
ncbi:PAS domain-containing protein [Hymenobacter sp. BT559]|uniref:PAS domain-containing protein n=1 Tax=Hymenobacter sp. BT559 TaxID=2795729 RepID=UPI0018ED68C8|nr:PAS domain-containing protein [Hymenobacter sp. BT559]MBJ6146368.1 PAS domain-containing protein [Hymenobacter sp. BT559]